MKLTVTVITHNEAAHITAALQSVSWADEIIVVDSHSTDGTVELARPLASRIEIRDWAGYGAQKNYAASVASNDWILSLDADERVTPRLADEIRALLTRGPDARGYRISRVTWYLGRWIRGTDWFPDFQLRLYDRRAGRWSERSVHESFELTERPRKLRGELEHYAYRDINHHLTKINQYTTMAAQDWVAHGRRTNALELLVHPPLAFLRNYVLRAGFRAGSAGLVISILNSYYVFLKLAKLWEMQRQSSVGGLQSSVGGLQSPVGSRQSSVDGRRSSVDSHQSLVHSHQSSVDSRQSSVESRQSSVESHKSPVVSPPDRTMERGPRIPDPGSRTVDSHQSSVDSPPDRTTERPPRIPDPGSRS